jgi:hypothetical protein
LCINHTAFRITIYALHCTSSQCRLYFSEISRTFTSISIAAVVLLSTYAKSYACKSDFLVVAVSELHISYPCRNPFTAHDSCIRKEAHYIFLFITHYYVVLYFGSYNL